MKDQVVVITGASSGIGLEVARLFSLEGARVYMIARDASRLDAAGAELAGDVHCIPADVTEPSSVHAMIKRLEEEPGRIDVLVNCAGQFRPGLAEELGPDCAETLMQVNYFGTVRMIHACLPLLRRSDTRTVVNLSSLAGRLAPPRMAAYSATKFAVNAYTQALRQELRSEGFHFALVYPGPVDTPMIKEHLGTERYPLPPMVPVTSAAEVAAQVLKSVRKRRRERVIPLRLGLGARLAAAAPELVEIFYRFALWMRRNSTRKPILLSKQRKQG